MVFSFYSKFIAGRTQLFTKKYNMQTCMHGVARSRNRMTFIDVYLEEFGSYRAPEQRTNEERRDKHADVRGG